jgi:predicted transposase/invertase (TIGR01784 family)
MQPTFADPKTDFVFKRIFGSEARTPLLMALLNHLLELDETRAIREIEHLSNEQHVDVPELKLSIVDVKCTDVSGRRFVVEMQVLKVEGFEKRVVYNTSKAYVMQLRNAGEYPSLCDVVGVTICNFNLWTEEDEKGSHKVPMLSRWRMQEQHTGEAGLPQVQYTFLELPKYKGGDNPVSLVDKWAYFFREAKNPQCCPASTVPRPLSRRARGSPSHHVLSRRMGRLRKGQNGRTGRTRSVDRGTPRGQSRGKDEGQSGIGHPLP